MCTLDFFFLMNVLFLETLFIFYLKKMKGTSSLEWSLISAIQTFRSQRQKKLQVYKMSQKISQKQKQNLWLLHDSPHLMLFLLGITTSSETKINQTFLFSSH